METGAGSLSPELYYTLLHSSYKSSAASTNKLSYRTLASIDCYNQIADADAIDSALVKRAEVEALNITDREIDIAWQTEGRKVTDKLEDFQKNINRILSAGGDVSGLQQWTEYYNMFDCAVQAVKEAYMPNAQRKKAYLRIYADITERNELLVKYLVLLNTRSHTSSLLSSVDTRVIHKDTIVSEARAHWKSSMNGIGYTGGNNASSGGDSDGEETVNR